MARRRSYRRRKGRRRNRNRYRVSVARNNVYVAVNADFTAGSATTLASAVVDEVANVSGETQNRKIARVRGSLDISALVGASQGADIIFMWLAWPKNLELPTIAEYDPFSNTTGVPGNPAYQGGVSAPFGIRRLAFGLPAGASAAVLGEPQRYASRGNRLLKPGFELRYALYAKRTGNADVAGRIAFNGSFEVLN